MKCQQVEVEVAAVEFISIYLQLFHLSGCATLADGYKKQQVDKNSYSTYSTLTNKCI